MGGTPRGAPGADAVDDGRGRRGERLQPVTDLHECVMSKQTPSSSPPQGGVRSKRRRRRRREGPRLYLSMATAEAGGGGGNNTTPSRHIRD